MILTEEEAKTKRCQESYGPPLLSTDGAVVGIYMGSLSAPVQSTPAYCIGSGCMAWRWGLDTVGLHKSTTHGYCGKAGHP
jgi:hypothetical protein